MTILIARLLASLSHWVPRQIALCAEKSAQVHTALGYTPRKMVVIPNGYDLGNFAPSEQSRIALRGKWGVPDAMPLFGMVSRYDPQKDHANLIHALARLREMGRTFRCALVGPGMTYENVELVQQIDRAGLAQAIMLMGPRNDIPAVMNALDLHLLSSSAEAFPNVLAEAMACGTPCVSTDVGDAALIVGETGWVAPPRNAEALASMIELALAARAQEGWQLRQKAARTRVEENFSLDHMVASYNAVWQRALA
jgi:glycosyltransferase involved in cell wall biosynthesis